MFRYIFDIHNIHDARLVLNSIMEDSVKQYGEFHRKFRCNGKAIHFNEKGEMEGATFHVLQIRDGKFCDADPNNTDDE